MHLIFAAMPGDEIIGCFSLIEATSNLLTVFYPSRMDDVEERGVRACAEYLGYDVIIGEGDGSDLSLAGDLADDHQIWYAPDPHFETHPLNMSIGHKAWDVAQKMGVDFVAYSTLMNVPYVQELSFQVAMDKRTVLDRYFAVRKCMWEYNDRYYKLEGSAEWHMK